eukprot:CAMPEP_0117685090 /NCGR_PEP_ID=MMETSP0804-20121206/21529_1 /TAXON_ID=1074897 /ORGANISM="Tetraselmis astigmatica, Strain CCMP880" /LENGTH=308 /DNA_ID=CAMNT_0005496289 /DNA_START=216 /DNA_END=1142 /DNA_ORIENTATION=+
MALANVSPSAARATRRQQPGAFSAASSRQAARVAHRGTVVVGSLPHSSSSNGSSSGRVNSSGVSGKAVKSEVVPKLSSTADLPSVATELGNSSTVFVAETLLPTRSGKFRVRAYRHKVGILMSEPTAIINGTVENQENVVVRVHDACFTSEVLGSMKCDCAEQLQLAMDYIQDNGPGMVIYLQQEGRGIGLANKIAAYALQEKGLDTVDANRKLGLPDDCREYTSVFNILSELGVKSIQLMTNNPRKVNTISCLGIQITKRIPCVVPANMVNQGYLDAKRQRMSHDLEPDSDSDLLDGSWCYWDHSGV